MLKEEQIPTDVHAATHGAELLLPLIEMSMHLLLLPHVAARRSWQPLFTMAPKLFCSSNINILEQKHFRTKIFLNTTFFS
jgi:hypothetical protein